MANLQAINEQVSNVMAALARLQRTLQTEIDQLNPPADARLTRAEWERVNAASLDDARAAEVAAQSAAMGNTDVGTQAKAAESKPAASTESKK